MIYILILMLIMIIIFFLLFYGDKNDFFSPRNIVPIIFSIKTLPYLLYISFQGVPLTINNDMVYRAISNKDNVVFYILLEIFSFSTMMFVINYFSSKSKNEKVDFKRIDEYTLNRKRKNLKIWAFFFLGIGLLSWIINIQSIGGLNFFLNNLQKRTIIMKDQDLLVWLSSFIKYGPILYIYSKKFNKKTEKINILFLIVVILVGLISGNGGRKNLLFLMIDIFMVYHYSIKNINIKKLFNLKTFFLSIFVGVIFIILPLLRTKGMFTYYLSNIHELINVIFDSFSNLIFQFSYVPFYITMVSYFNKSNLWYGSSFKGLLTSFIPSSLYPNKPPVDDGMYFYSIAQGREDIFPTMPTSSLNASSYPLETFGSMYANFGAIGVIIGYAALGIILSLVYNKMKNKKYSLFFILLYSNILFNFQFSTLRIFQLIFSVILSFVVVSMSEKISFIKKKKILSKFQ